MGEARNALEKVKEIYSINLPDYRTSKEPRYVEWGKAIDGVIAEHFSGRNVVVRYLSTQDHPGMSAEALIQVIQKTGTDRYDPGREMSVAHDFYTEKGVELFAVRAFADTNLDISAEALRDFREGAIHDRGYSVIPDIIIVYDADQLEMIPIQYGTDVGEDVFRFKDRNHKADAVLAILTLQDPDRDASGGR